MVSVCVWIQEKNTRNLPRGHDRNFGRVPSIFCGRNIHSKRMSLFSLYSKKKKNLCLTFCCLQKSLYPFLSSSFFYSLSRFGYMRDAVAYKPVQSTRDSSSPLKRQKKHILIEKFERELPHHHRTRENVSHSAVSDMMNDVSFLHHESSVF